MRQISEKFINDLCAGELSFFLTQVLDNRDVLSLEIRNGYINIYYRGGNLLRIREKSNGYTFEFDVNYCRNKSDESKADILGALNPNSADDFQLHFLLMMQEMDSWFKEHPKPEREYQHKLVLHNSDIIDIEYQVGQSKRFDMLAVVDGKLIVMENKYGMGAISGKTGLAKHYENIADTLNNQQEYQNLVASVVKISEIKKRLGLSETAVKKEAIQRNEILFLIVNYNPKSKTIKNEADKMPRDTVHTPARIVFLQSTEYKIDWNNTEDIFAAGR